MRYLLDTNVTGKPTVRAFDGSCLTPVHRFAREEIRARCERESIRSTVFAYRLNVSRVSGSPWERENNAQPAHP